MPVFNNQLAGAAGSGGAADFKIERSLRFNIDDSAYLHRQNSSSTTSSAKKFTLSFWVKRVDSASNRHVFFSAPSLNSWNSWTTLYFMSSGQLQLEPHISQGRITTVAKYLDYSAWSHFVISVDSTLSTAADRIKIFHNGVRQAVTGTNANQDQTFAYGLASNYQQIGFNSSSYGMNGLLAEMHFVDDQAIDPTEFGGYDDNTGVWNPKQFSGTHGVNGWHLDFSDNSSNAALGFDANVFGTRYSAYVTGFGSPGPANMFDGDATTSYAVSASNTRMTFTPPTAIPYTDASGGVEVKFMASASGQQDRVRINGGSWVAQPANGGWYKVSTGDGNITSMDFEDEGTSEAVVHAIRVNGTILTDPAGANDWTVNNLSATGTGVGTSGWTNKIGGPQSTWDSATTTSTVSSGTSWSTNGNNNTLHFDTQALGTHTITLTKTGGGNEIDFETSSSSGSGYSRVTNSSSTITISSTSSSQTHSYNRYVRFSGSGSGNVTFSISGTAYGSDNSAIDSLFDSPTNYEADSGNNGGNYCVLNPLDQNTATLTNGNLQAQVDTDGARFVRGTIAVSSGKWFWECKSLQGTSMALGVVETTGTGNLTHSQSYYYYANNGTLYGNSTGKNGSFSGSALANGDVLGVALDMDNGTLQYYKNGSLIGTAWTDLTGKTVAPAVGNGGGGPNITACNFGQRPFSISSVPTGFKALCTQNLDDPLIADPSTAFDVVAYSGDGQTPRSISLGFSPSLVWTKHRSGTQWHYLIDKVRGNTKALFANTTNAEYTTSGEVLKAFNSDGYTLGNDSAVNANNNSYVSWNWDAGDLATNSAYNQSAVWSDGTSSNPTQGSWANVFASSFSSSWADGTDAWVYNASATLNFSSALPTGAIQVYATASGASATDCYVSFSDGTNTYTTGNLSGVNHGWVDVASGSSLSGITSVTINSGPSSSEGLSLKAIKVAGKELVDAGLIPVGSLNSSVYDTRTLWRNAMSGTVYPGQGYAFSQLFDNSSSIVEPAANTMLTFTTPTGSSLSGVLEVDMTRGASSSTANNTYDFQVNGVSVFNHNTFPHNGSGVVNLGYFANITSIAWGNEYNTNSNNWIAVSDIRVNGKELVDSDVTPVSVPTVASTVRTNPTAGFSIVTYSQGAAGSRVSHGLNKNPDMIIAKTRSLSTQPWVVYHSALGKGGVVQLHNTDMNNTSYPTYWGSEEPDSNFFGTYTGSAPWANNAGDMLAYCFTSVEGYSAFGKYDGTGTTNGQFVYTGFRPRWVMHKRIDGGGTNVGDWRIWDTARDVDNAAESILFPNGSGAEATNSAHALNILSNGFQFKTSDSNINASGASYLYAAFAESPLKYARAR